MSDFSTSGARTKSDLRLHGSIPATADLRAIVFQKHVSDLETSGSHLLASLSSSLSIDEAVIPNILSQACFMLSNQLDMQGRTTRKLLDWVGVSAELTILKSFFSIKAYTVVAVWEALLKSSVGLKHQRAFEVLLEVGFLIDRHEWITRRSEWIFSSAVKLPALHVVKRLFSSGASPDNVDFKFQPVIGIAMLDTPLGYAAKALHMEMIEILFANGAEVNLQSIRGAEDSIERFFDTPLFTMLSRDFLSEKLNSASSADILFCIHLLLDAGADVDV